MHEMHEAWLVWNVIGVIAIFVHGRLVLFSDRTDLFIIFVVIFTIFLLCSKNAHMQ